MKKSTVFTIVIILIAANIATIIAAEKQIAYVKATEASKFSDKVNELDRFYYGFCDAAKSSGYGSLADYQNLCGTY
jgi:hypothetical protein